MIIVIVIVVVVVVVVVIMDGGSGGPPAPPHAPLLPRPSASCAARALRPFGCNNDNNRIMLGGGALPPLHPPCWPAVGRRENIGSRGAPAPPHTPR